MDRLTQETSVHNAFDDVASTASIYESLPCSKASYSRYSASMECVGTETARWYARRTSCIRAASEGLTDNACHVILHIVDPRFGPADSARHDMRLHSTQKTKVYNV